MLPASDTYPKWNRLILAVVLFLFLSAFLIPADRSGDWIPLVSGYIETDILYENVWWSAALGIFFLLLLFLPVYLITHKTLSHSFNWNFTWLFLSAFIFSDPASVYFSGIYPAAVCWAWAQYCFLEKQKFTSFLLLASGTLFYAPLLWCIPCIFILALIGSTDVLRDAARYAGGAAVPFIYLFSFRYIVYNDLDYFLLQYLDAVSGFGVPFYTPAITVLFLILCIAFVFIHAVIGIAGKMSRYSPIAASILRMEFIYVFLLSGIFFLFSRAGNAPLCILPAPSLALVFSHYFGNRLEGNAVRIELILLLCALVIARAAYFVN